jgi:glycosyltransferase involved in cell wall biosynthesis
MASIHVLAKVIDRSVGSAIYTIGLMRRLAERGHRITLICRAAVAEVERWCEVVRLAAAPLAQAPLLWRGAAVFEMTGMAAELRAARPQAPDLVLGSAQQLIWAHQQVFPRAPLIYLPHSLVTPVEVATYAFGCRLQKALTVGLFGQLERRALRRSACTVRFTHAGCRALEAYYGRATARRFVVWPAPMEMPEWGVERPAAVPRLLCVGRLVESKNVGLLVRCLAPLQHLPWRLDIVGDGPERSSLEEQVERHGLHERIAFHGRQEDVAPWYRAASLLLFPSQLESAGLVVLEAMSHGVPALAIRADGRRYHNVNHELIDSGRDGFLAGTEDEFAQVLAKLLTTPDRLRDVGRQARQTIARRHRWSDHVDRFEELFSQVRRARPRTCRAIS